MKNNSYKILIVDDNNENIQVLANLLSQHYYDVDYALNGSDALDLINSDDFDLILLDIMMPVMDGFEVCKKIRENKATNEIPIIFLTAKTDVESIEKAFQQGGVDYLCKPFISEELLARVKTHIELKNSKEELRNVNIWLEEKVSERTTELNKANKKLLELDNAKSQFIKIISHEIRTPLNGIIVGLELLKDSGLTEEATSLIDILDLSATRLEEFSKKALDISLFNLYGKKLLKLEKSNINEIILNVINKIELEEKGKKIHFIKLSTEVNAVIDSNYFHKCLYNIIHNAFKFSRDGDLISIIAINSDNQLSISIKDEGFGFKKGFSINGLRVFDNINHIDNNPGMGLYLSNQIIKAHDGHIEIGNNTDKGAFVKIYVPNNQ